MANPPMGGRTATLDGGRRPEQSPRDDDRGRAGRRRRRGHCGEGP